MTHNKKYSIILIFFFINCKVYVFSFSSLFKNPRECKCYTIEFDEGFKKYYANIFAGIGCVIDNPIAYYLRILVDVFAWYFRISKVKNKSRYYKTYYGTELGVAFYPLHRYRVTSFCLELNFNILSWLLYSPFEFITKPDMFSRLVYLVLFDAIIVNSSIFMCNFSLLKKHLKIHAVNIMQIVCLFIPGYNHNYIRVVKETIYNNGSIAETHIQTHYKFGKFIKRNLPVTYIYDIRKSEEKFDSPLKAIVIIILNTLLPCISITI